MNYEIAFYAAILALAALAGAEFAGIAPGRVSQTKRKIEAIRVLLEALIASDSRIHEARRIIWWPAKSERRAEIMEWVARADETQKKNREATERVNKLLAAENR